MSQLRIVHSHAEGTLIEGSSKGDGVYAIVRKHGFRYMPSIERIGIYHSRDHVAKVAFIQGAAAALRKAGHEVQVVIDDTPRPREQVLADQAERLDDRKDRLETQAARHAAASDAAHARADQISERFYMGQPILIGHHSEKSARADQARMHAAMDRSLAEQRAAQDAAYRASRVGVEAARRERPDVTRRRIETAEAELRKIGRLLDGATRNYRNAADEIYYTEVDEPATGAYRERLIARKTQVEDQIRHDQQLLAASNATIWDKGNVHVGDKIRTRHWYYGWREVVKVNTKTVAVPTDYSWTDKVPFTDIVEVRCPHTEPSDVDGPESMPADMPDTATDLREDPETAYPITLTPATSGVTVQHSGTFVEPSSPDMDAGQREPEMATPAPPQPLVMSEEDGRWVWDNVFTKQIRNDDVQPNPKCACQWGVCGHCSAGNHHRCVHFGQGHKPAPGPEGWILRRNGTVVHPDEAQVWRAGKPCTWVCQCDTCRTDAAAGATPTTPGNPIKQADPDPVGQLSLFDLLTA